jgi:hypothetical protein
MFFFFNVVRAIPHQLPSGQDLEGPGFFVVTNFRQLVTKKQVPTPTKGFLRIFLKIRHTSRKKS